jgi:hypothetical protein
MTVIADRSIPAALERWYADHSAIRRLWAIEDSSALLVYVVLEPSSDGDDSLPVWLANQQGWTDDLRQVTNREVQLQLIASGGPDEPYEETIAELRWRDLWE